MLTHRASLTLPHHRALSPRSLSPHPLSTSPTPSSITSSPSLDPPHPLHTACAALDLPAISIFLRYSFSLHTLNIHHQTPLQSLLLHHDSDSTVETLLDHLLSTLPPPHQTSSFIPESFLLPAILTAAQHHRVASLRVLLEYRAEDPDRNDESLGAVLEVLAKDLTLPGETVVGDMVVSLLHHAISPGDSVAWGRFLYDVASLGRVDLVRLLVEEDGRVLGQVNRVFDELDGKREGRFGTAVYAAMRMAAGVWEARRGVLSVGEFVRRGKGGRGERFDVWYSKRVAEAVEVVGVLVGGGADVEVCGRLWEADERLDARDGGDRERVREVVEGMREVVEEEDGVVGFWRVREEEMRVNERGRRECGFRSLRRSNGERELRRESGLRGVSVERGRWGGEEGRELRKSQSALGRIGEDRWDRDTF